MTLTFPESQQEILDRMVSDAQAILSTLNPGLRESFIKSLLVAFAGGSFEQFESLKILLNELFLDTSTGDFLARWGTYKNITRNAASQAQGFITATGISLSTIPILTIFASADGTQYQTLSEQTILAQSLSVNSLTRIGSVATGQTVSDHNLASGVSITISGAIETEYNGTFTITVTGPDSFTYEITGTPTTPATGTILAGFDTASIEVQSTDTGQIANQLAGVALTILSPIAGVDDTAFVQFGEIGGGTDTETDDDFSTRILDSYQNPFALNNASSLVAQAKLVSGVTRVFVEETTPDAGQMTVYFTRDNDEDIIPSLSEVTAVKNKLLEILSGFVLESDLIVLAPVAVSVDFIFTSVIPATVSMQQAIINSLNQFFREKTTVGENIKDQDYICAITDTIDTSSGLKLEDFTLSSPVGDIPITTGEIGTLGTVNFV